MQNLKWVSWSLFRTFYYATCSFTYLLAMVASNKALMWVNYPTQVKNFPFIWYFISTEIKEKENGWSIILQVGTLLFIRLHQWISLLSIKIPMTMNVWNVYVYFGILPLFSGRRKVLQAHPRHDSWCVGGEEGVPDEKVLVYPPHCHRGCYVYLQGDETVLYLLLIL